MKIAKEIKTLDGWRGDARVFQLDPPMPLEKGSTEYVVVSAAYAPFTGPETYIFPSDADGNVQDWGELDGSYRGGGTRHSHALYLAGYTVEAA